MYPHFQKQSIWHVDQRRYGLYEFVKNIARPGRHRIYISCWRLCPAVCYVCVYLFSHLLRQIVSESSPLPSSFTSKLLDKDADTKKIKQWNLYTENCNNTRNYVAKSSHSFSSTCRPGSSLSWGDGQYPMEGLYPMERPWAKDDSWWQGVNIS